jgi:tetratricopeptide (TPR) repeat protein
MLTEDDYLLPLLRQLPALDSATSLARLQAAADSHPTDPRPLALIAAEYAQAKAYDQAEGAFIAALRRAPDYVPARFQLGLLQLSSGRPAAASATWEPLSELPDDNEYRLFKTGLDCLAQNRFAEAAQWLRSGLAANHSNPALNTDMQRFLVQIDRIESSQSAMPVAGDDQLAAPEDQATAEHFLVTAYGKLH